MRTLVITLVIFGLLCIAIFANYLYINRTAKKLTELALSVRLDDNGKKTLEEIQELWEKSSPLFSLSVGFREIDCFGEVLLSLSSAYENNEKAEFEKQRSLLLDAINGLSRLEEFSIMNIF